MNRTWFIHVRYRRGVPEPERRVEKDFVRLSSLEQAIEVLLPAHVKNGWRVREETQIKQGIVVLKIWKPYVGLDGIIEARQVFPAKLDR